MARHKTDATANGAVEVQPQPAQLSSEFSDDTNFDSYADDGGYYNDYDPGFDTVEEVAPPVAGYDSIPPAVDYDSANQYSEFEADYGDDRVEEQAYSEFSDSLDSNLDPDLQPDLAADSAADLGPDQGAEAEAVFSGLADEDFDAYVPAEFSGAEEDYSQEYELENISDFSEPADLGEPIDGPEFPQIPEVNLKASEFSEFEDYSPTLNAAHGAGYASEFEPEFESEAESEFDSYDYQPEEVAGSDAEGELEGLSEGSELEAEAGYEPDPDLVEPEGDSDLEGDEDEVEEFIDPRAARSKVAFSSNPLIKAAFVAASGLIVILVGGSIYSLLIGSGGNRNQAAANLEQTQEAQPDTAQELPESGRLKAELAFSSQQNDLERSRRLREQEAQPKPKPSPQVHSAVPAAIPQAAPAPMPLPMPLPMPRPSAPVAPAAPVQVDPYADLSPIERWQTIASMGSFGRANPSAIRSQTPVQPVPTASAPAPAAAAPPVRPAGSSTSANGLSNLRSASATPGMRSAPLADVLVGTTATGSMATAVVLSADNSEAVSPTSPNAVRYLVQIDSAIKDANGATAIPAGATLVTVVSGFSPQSGMMQLAVRGVIYNNREYSAPEGAILIRGRDGASLRADRIGGTNPIVGALLPSILQGAATAAGTLTQNRGTTVTNGSVTTTTNNNSPDVGAGFIQGATQSLSQQIQQATQTANASAQGRPQSWRLDQGKAVQVFVNSTFQM